MDRSIKPKISIAIPVRNGEEYLLTAIRSSLEAVGVDGEVVVSLNACTDGSEAIANSLTDERLRILKTSTSMSMPSHWEFLLSNLRGEWIVFIGHDDALIPNLTTHLSQIERQFPGVDSISFRRALFFWPGVEGLYGDKFWKYSGSFTAKRFSPKRRLLSVLFGAGSYADLPMVYSNCLVKKSLVDSIQRGGRFFNDVAPDVYSSVAISLASRFSVYCDVPAFWVGTSPSSTGLSLSNSTQSNSAVATSRQRERASEFLRECAADGFEPGPSVRKIGYENLSSPLLLLSAIENLGAAPRWLRNGTVKSLCFQRHINIVSDSGVGLLSREIKSEGRFSSRILLAAFRLTRGYWSRMSSQWRKRRKEFNLVEKYPNGYLKAVSPLDVNAILEQKGYLSGTLNSQRPTN